MPGKSKGSSGKKKSRKTFKSKLTKKQQAIFRHLMSGGSKDDIPE